MTSNSKTGYVFSLHWRIRVPFWHTGFNKAYFQINTNFIHVEERGNSFRNLLPVSVSLTELLSSLPAAQHYLNNVTEVSRIQSKFCYTTIISSRQTSSVTFCYLPLAWRHLPAKVGNSLPSDRRLLYCFLVPVENTFLSTSLRSTVETFPQLVWI